MIKITYEAQDLLDDVASEFSRLNEVSAVALSGSKWGELADELSDIDLYIYSETEPSKIWRSELAQQYGKHESIGNEFWEHGDEWVATRNGVVVDIMYRSPSWIEEQFVRVIDRHQASVGYSTCFVHNVLCSKPLYDRDGWYESLQEKARQPYSDRLQKAIIAKNHPILRDTLSSYFHQIEIALSRNDIISINHRVTALLASYFDILFAVNRVFHPGEKRLLGYALAKCPKRPPQIQIQVNGLLASIADTEQFILLQRVNELLDGLDAFLVSEGLVSAK